MLDKKKIALNTLVGSGSKLVSLAISFFLVPVVIDALGDVRYGIFAVVTALVAYAGLLDFGIGPGLVRHYAEFAAAGRRSESGQVTTFSVLFYLLIGSLIAAGVLVASPFIVGFLRVPDGLRAETSLAMLLIVLHFTIWCIGGIFSARLVAAGRMDVASIVSTLGQVLNLVLMLVLLPRYGTVTAAVALNCIEGVLTCATLGLMAFAHDRRLFVAPWEVSRATVRKLFIFGGWMQINSLAALVNLETDKIIVSRFAGVSTVTSFQIGTKLASLNRIVPLQLLVAIMPDATGIAMRRPADVQAFYGTMTRYLMVLTLGITGLVIASSGTLVSLWIGRSIPEAATVTTALAISFAINNLTGVGTTLVRAAEKPKYEAYYGLLSMVLNIGLTVALAPAFGVAGIVAGTVVASIVGSIFFLALFHRLFAIPWWSTVGTWLWKLLCATVLGSASVWLADALAPVPDVVNRLQAAVRFAVEAPLFGAVFLGCLYALGFWTEAEYGRMRRAAAILGRSFS